MKIYCFDTGKNRNILAGEYYPGLHNFVKKVTRKHYMVLEKGYGIQEEVLQQLKSLGCISVSIVTKTGISISLLENWLKQPIKNYGHGKQRFLGGK